MKYLLAIDPGKSTGIVYGYYDHKTPWTRKEAWQVPGGIAGFREWLDSITLASMGDSDVAKEVMMCEWVSERFIPLTGRGFAHTSDSIEPVRIEGALIALGLISADYDDPTWQRPAAMYRYGGSNAAERKKGAQEFLKKQDLWLTGKDVEQPDANDANSATLHALAYMFKTGHRPTIEKYLEND